MSHDCYRTEYRTGFSDSKLALPVPGNLEAPTAPIANMIPATEITSEHDLLPEGGQPGTIPTDLEQSTGLERLEILGKMQGVDIFDMSPLDASRKGRSTLRRANEGSILMLV